MRPVVKPASHPGYTNGKAYREAQQPLSSVLGPYCSYCERYLAHKPEVEHKRPKSLNPGLETTWTNFLLSCGNCNAPKSNRNTVYLKDSKGRVWTEIIPGTYETWPDDLHDPEDYSRDTFNMIVYKEGGLVAPNPKIQYSQDHDRVVATLAIVNLGHIANAGFDIGNLWFEKDTGTFENAKSAMGFKLSGKRPVASLMQRYKPADTPITTHVSKSVPDSLLQRVSLGTAGPSVKDLRVPQRIEAWDMAHHCRKHFDAMVIGSFLDPAKNLGGTAPEQGQTLTKKQARRQITQMRYAARDLAKSKGFWSIWITAFQAGNPLPEFNTRHAVVPMLKTLLRTQHFPATRANNEFMPPIYDDADTAFMDGVNNGRQDPFWDLELARTEVENLTETIDEMEDTVEEARKDAVRLRKKNAQLKTDNDDLDNRLTQTQDSLTDTTAERDDLQNQNQQLNAQIADLQQRLNTCVQRQGRYRRERDAARQQVQQLQQPQQDDDDGSMVF